MTRRLANVWTPEGIATHEVEGEWPEHLVLGRWITTPEIARDGSFLVTRGRHSGTEFLKYGCAREFSCEDLPALMAALGLDKEYRRGDGKHPNVDRSAREGERADAGAVAGDGRQLAAGK